MRRRLWEVWTRDWRVTLALIVALELAGVVYDAVVRHWAAPGTVFGPSADGTVLQIGAPQLGWTVFDLFCWWRVHRGSRGWLWVQRILTAVAVLLVVGGLGVPWAGLGVRDGVVLAPLLVVLVIGSVLEFAPSLDRHVSRAPQPGPIPDRAG